MDVELGKRIKDLMDEREITQTELARRCGISQSMVSKIISDDRRPLQSVLLEIARVLGITVASLVGGETELAGWPSRSGKSGGGKTLRQIVSYSGDCKEKFLEAEVLAKRIFESGEYVPLPFYTEHGTDHCKAIEAFLEQMIWKNENGELDEKQDFVPSPEEAMYLLSAVWLHDLGMWYGILDNERPKHLQDATKVISLRNRHEIRTARYIQDQWPKRNCSWEPDERGWLSNICVYHRKKHPISTFEPVRTYSRHTVGEIRLSVLAALVRLADVCHVDKSRAPERVMGLYISLGMPQEAQVHWERSDLIQNVKIDHKERKIVIKGHYPQEVDFGLGEFVSGPATGATNAATVINAATAA